MDRAAHGPCYTCRSRRIQCDQTSVPCAKCQKAGLECFDKRPFRWVKGVAIRGKMQGRSYENADEAMATNSAVSSPGPARSRRALVRSSHVQRLGSQSPGFQLNGTSHGFLASRARYAFVKDFAEIAMQTAYPVFQWACHSTFRILSLWDWILYPSTMLTTVSTLPTSMYNWIS